MVKLKIGDTVWVFSPNNRVYDANKKVIYAEYFVPMTIWGETSRSWIIARTQGGFEEKIPKNIEGDTYQMKDRVAPRTVFLTREAVDANIWMAKHHHQVVRAVQNVRDIAIIKQVATIIGYKEDSES